MVLANDPDFFNRLNANKKNNRPPARFSDLQAALGLSQLSRYPQMLEKRKAIATRYFSELHEQLTWNSGELDARAFREVHVRNSVFFRFPILVEGDPVKHIAALEQQFGISLRRGVDALLHDPSAEKFPGAEKRFASTLSVPLYPALTETEVTHIIQSLNSYFGT